MISLTLSFFLLIDIIPATTRIVGRKDVFYKETIPILCLKDRTGMP